ncbi:MAG: hypothetical protein V2A73_16415 [Pseudomonadota bacterium]
MMRHYLKLAENLAWYAERGGVPAQGWRELIAHDLSEGKAFNVGDPLDERGSIRIRLFGTKLACDVITDRFRPDTLYVLQIYQNDPSYEPDVFFPYRVDFVACDVPRGPSLDFTDEFVRAVRTIDRPPKPPRGRHYLHIPQSLEVPPAFPAGKHWRQSIVDDVMHDAGFLHVIQGSGDTIALVGAALFVEVRLFSSRLDTLHVRSISLVQPEDRSQTTKVPAELLLWNTYELERGDMVLYLFEAPPPVRSEPASQAGAKSVAPEPAAPEQAKLLLMPEAAEQAATPTPEPLCFREMWTQMGALFERLVDLQVETHGVLRQLAVQLQKTGHALASRISSSSSSSTDEDTVPK